MPGMSLREAKNKLSGGPVAQLLRVLGDAHAVLDRAVEAEDALADAERRCRKAIDAAEADEQRAAAAKVGAEHWLAAEAEAKGIHEENEAQRRREAVERLAAREQAVLALEERARAAEATVAEARRALSVGV